jgi:hypothetical protein
MLDQKGMDLIESTAVIQFLQEVTGAIAHMTEGEEGEDDMFLCPNHTLLAIGGELGDIQVDVRNPQDLDAYLRGVSDCYNMIMSMATSDFQTVAATGQPKQ